MTRLSIIPLAIVFHALAGCSSPTIGDDPFEATGELIAFSGGEAGAAGACSTCHGTRGEGDDHLAPRLAGLGQGYALRQMENFASGARQHPQMQWVAGRLDANARAKVTAYYASMEWNDASASSTAAGCSAATAYHEGIPARGIASCASCHGADGRGNAGNPPLAGQSARYLTHQLDAWAKGERYGDGGAAMMAISRSLHPADRQAVAAYAASLGGAGGGRLVPATCLQTRRPDPPDDA